MSDKQSVLREFPKAWAFKSSFIPPKWVIEATLNGRALGIGRTESTAWADAAKRISAASTTTRHE